MSPTRVTTLMTRRRMLQATALAGGALAGRAAYDRFLGDVLFASQPAAPADALTAMRAQMGAAPIEPVALGDNLTMLSGPGGNVVVLNGPDGKVVVDTFVLPAWDRLKQALDGMGGASTTLLINTHWHFDHTDNNANFRQAGADDRGPREHRQAAGRIARAAGDALRSGARRRTADPDVRRPSRPRGQRREPQPGRHSARPYRYGHLHPVPEGQRDPPGRHLLQRRLPRHRRGHGREHQRDDPGGGSHPEVGRPDDQDRARATARWPTARRWRASGTCWSRCATASRRSSRAAGACRRRWRRGRRRSSTRPGARASCSPTTSSPSSTTRSDAPCARDGNLDRGGDRALLGLHDLPAAAARGDGRGARRPRLARRAADRRRQVALLSGAGRRAAGPRAWSSRRSSR